MPTPEPVLRQRVTRPNAVASCGAPKTRRVHMAVAPVTFHELCRATLDEASLVEKQTHQGVRFHRRHNRPPAVLDHSLLEHQPRVSVPGMHLVLRREPAFEQGGLSIIRSL